MQRYRTMVIAFVTVGLLILGITAAHAFTVTRLTMYAGDHFSGEILKGTVKTRGFTASNKVKYHSVRYNGVHHHAKVLAIKSAINFEGKKMPCSGGGPFAKAYNESRIHFYFMDSHGRNYDVKMRLPCQNDTYVSVWKNVTVPYLFRGARWKANWTVDVTGGSDPSGTNSGRLPY